MGLGQGYGGRRQSRGCGGGRRALPRWLVGGRVGWLRRSAARVVPWLDLDLVAGASHLDCRLGFSRFVLCCVEAVEQFGRGNVLRNEKNRTLLLLGFEHATPQDTSEYMHKARTARLAKSA